MNNNNNNNVAFAVNHVRLCGSSNSLCGYCEGERSALVGKAPQESSKTYGLLVNTISCHDYELLVNQGWRRSGVHCYKPDNWESCCPAFAIRLPVKDFSPTKSQKRVLKKMEKALQPEQPTQPAKKKRKRQLSSLESLVMTSVPQILQQWTREALLSSGISEVKTAEIHFKAQPNRKNTSENTVTLMTTICAAIAGKSGGQWKRDALSSRVCEHLNQQLLSTKMKNAMNNNFSIPSITSHAESGQIFVSVRVESTESDDDPSVPHLQDQNMTASTVDSGKDLIRQWLLESSPRNGTAIPTPPYEITVTTIPATQSALEPDVHKLYFRYQQEVHNDPNPTENNNLGDDDDDWGEICDEDWRIKVEAMLQREYENLTPAQFQSMRKSFVSFYRFLVESPLVPDHPPDGNNSNNSAHHRQHHHHQDDRLYGTLHQQYRIGGKLIAVGVVDVLPRGLSSVYSFYHPKFSHSIFPLGKYTLLREIEYCRDTLRLPYYYLGYYIESCGKMRYKADYQPSELLCPTHSRWVNAQEAQRIIRKDSPKRHCCTFYKQPMMNNNMTNYTLRIMPKIPLIVGAATLVTLNMLHSGGQDIVRPLLEEFVSQVGPEVSQRCIIKLA